MRVNDDVEEDAVMEKIFVRPAKEAEFAYAYTHDDGDKVAKCIGHLRADFGRSGTEFWTTWSDHNAELKTQDFKDILDDVINRFRTNKVFNPLKSRSRMAKWCCDYPEAEEENSIGQNYVFRADEGDYSFVMRMNPNPGFYNLYCYCYWRDALDKSIELDKEGEE